MRAHREIVKMNMKCCEESMTRLAATLAADCANLEKVRLDRKQSIRSESGNGPKMRLV